MKNRNCLNLKNFNEIDIFLKKFSIKSFTNKNKLNSYINFFELENLVKKKKADNFKVKNPDYLIQVKKEKRPLPFEYHDLCRLHWLILIRRVFNTLEFGSGFSTVFIADAKFILKNYFGTVENIRCDKQFHIYSLGEDKNFLNITKKRLLKEHKSHVSLIFSKIKTIKYQDKFALKHENVPNISPDLIYLDGPSILNVKKLMGFSYNNISRVPMSADILLIEFFLEPGTFIVVDGRGANAEFLRYYLKRKWKYLYDKKGDCHFFELMEKPWGEWNIKKRLFCLKNKKIF